MAFPQSSHLPGSENHYQVNPACKPYTLRDYGFQMTKAGNFEFDRRVQPDFREPRSVRFKVLVAGDLAGLKMQVTNEKGLKVVNIYKNEAMADFKREVEFLLADMVKEDVLAPAEKA